jgi:hypothetical protein
MARVEGYQNKTITLPVEVKRRLALQAVREDTNLKNYIETILTNHSNTLDNG